MANIYFQTFTLKAPTASIPDTTPPTFGGITGATANLDGSLTPAWSPASDGTPPIEYLIYIALGSVTAAALFVPGNLVTIAPYSASSKKVFTLSDQTTYILKGQQYTLGVRAKDDVGNIDSNTAIQVKTAIASGNLPSVFQTIASQLAATEALLAADEAAIAATEVLLAADHANIHQDHLDLANDHANFVAENAAFAAENAALSTIVTNSQTVLDSITAGGGTALVGIVDSETVLTSEQVETVLNVELIESF